MTVLVSPIDLPPLYTLASSWLLFIMNVHILLVFNLDSQVNGGTERSFRRLFKELTAYIKTWALIDSNLPYYK